MKKYLLCSETDRGVRRVKFLTAVIFGALLFSVCTAAGVMAQYREDPVDKELERRKSD